MKSLRRLYLLRANCGRSMSLIVVENIPTLLSESFSITSIVAPVFTMSSTMRSSSDSLRGLKVNSDVPKITAIGIRTSPLKKILWKKANSDFHENTLLSDSLPIKLKYCTFNPGTVFPVKNKFDISYRSAKV